MVVYIYQNKYMKYTIRRKINLQRLFKGRQYESVDFEVSGNTQKECDEGLDSWIKEWIVAEKIRYDNKEEDNCVKTEHEKKVESGAIPF